MVGLTVIQNLGRPLFRIGGYRFSRVGKMGQQVYAYQQPIS